MTDYEGKLIKADTHIQSMDVGMIFEDGVTWDAWEEKGRELGVVIKLFSEHLRWWLGDWLNYGQRKFGEKYTQATEVTMYSIGTLRNCAWVCSNVPMQNRNPGLSFDHHYEVAKLPIDQQKDWLVKADLNHWTVKDLRRAMSGDPNPTRKCLPDKVADTKEDRKKNLTFAEWYIDHVAELESIPHDEDRYEYVWKAAKS